MSRPQHTFKGKPPERGVFPLDHEAECKQTMKTYLQCLQKQGTNHFECRDLSAAYLQCRMDRGLMAKEDLKDLGFRKENDELLADRVDKIGEKERDGFLSGENVKTRRRGWWA